MLSTNYSFTNHIYEQDLALNNPHEMQLNQTRNCYIMYYDLYKLISTVDLSFQQ